MSSLIEQAAERLAQLRAAGVEVPDIDTPAPGAPAAGMSAPLSPWAPPAQQLVCAVVTYYACSLPSMARPCALIIASWNSPLRAR